MARGEIVVTGASGALGSGVVRALAAGGERVVAVVRDATRGAAAFAGVSGCRVLAVDISSQRSWSDALGDSSIAGAVLAAGGWQGGKHFGDAEAEPIWEAMLSSNLETARVSLAALLPRLVAAKSGSVVAVGSRAAVRPWEAAGAAAYAASKAGLLALLEAAAAEVRDDGVRLNAVLPSTIDTPANRSAMPNADFSKWVSVESLSGVIAFLLSDAARDISGAALPVYGRA